jgi:transketolase
MIGDYLDPRKEFGKAVTELARDNGKIVVVSADSGNSSGFGDFARLYPDRYVELGIMEQGAVGVASGLATVGKIPVFCAIAPFVTARPFEMFRNDLGYMNQNVKIVGRNCGFSYSDLGATHHSLEDFAIIRMIPGVVVLAPQDPTEIRSAVKAMIEHVGPVYMRIGNPKIPVLFEEKPFVIGRGSILRDGGDVTIITTGSTTEAVLKAAEKLAGLGVDAQVIGMPTVCPIDRELVIDAAKKTGRIVTVEEHYADGGLGSLVCEICSSEYPVPVKRLGVPKLYATSGPYEELLEYYGLDMEGIVKSVKAFAKRKL